ncbi:MAG: paraslipin [Rickettsiales bacterium]|nr:paraslipin [Rickettsiales bacterium]
MSIFALLILLLVVIIIFKCVKIVPQQEVWIIETFGKYSKKLEPGLSFLVPFVQSIAAKQSLRERVVDIKEQTAITSDNVTLVIDGIIYVKVIDPVSASYGVDDPFYAVSQLAQTAMRSEIGKIVLDRTFEEREHLNVSIVQIINEAAKNWGIQCMRYEIKDITPPKNVLEAMELQVAAERKKRAQILTSEGDKQALINNAEAKKTESILASEAEKLVKINEAEGRKTASILSSEAEMIESVNIAKGKGEALLLVAQGTAESYNLIAKSLETEGGKSAANIKIIEDYIKAFNNLAKTNNTMLIPTNPADISSIIAQAGSILNNLNKKDTKNNF